MKYIDEPQNGVEYTKRPGSYALIQNDVDNLIGIITAKDEYFLLGGGIEKDETVMEALERETREEIGYSLKDIEPIAEIGSYFLSDAKGYLNVEAHIHVAKLDKKMCEPVEHDHVLLWVDPQEYIGKMSQRWQDEVLKEYIEFIKKTKFSETDLIRAHTCCAKNREQLKKTKKCGCIYCLKIFDTAEIKEWCDDGQTAICPHCKIDSILYDNPYYPITEEFLKIMKEHWF